MPPTTTTATATTRIRGSMMEDVTESTTTTMKMTPSGPATMTTNPGGFVKEENDGDDDDNDNNNNNNTDHQQQQKHHSRVQRPIAGLRCDDDDDDDAIVAEFQNDPDRSRTAEQQLQESFTSLTLMDVATMTQEDAATRTTTKNGNVDSSANHNESESHSGSDDDDDDFNFNQSTRSMPEIATDKRTNVTAISQRRRQQLQKQHRALSSNALVSKTAAGTTKSVHEAWWLDVSSSSLSATPEEMEYVRPISVAVHIPKISTTSTEKNKTNPRTIPNNNNTNHSTTMSQVEEDIMMQPEAIMLQQEEPTSVTAKTVQHAEDMEPKATEIEEQTADDGKQAVEIEQEAVEHENQVAGKSKLAADTPLARTDATPETSEDHALPATTVPAFGVSMALTTITESFLPPQQQQQQRQKQRPVMRRNDPFLSLISSTALTSTRNLRASQILLEMPPPQQQQQQQQQHVGQSPGQQQPYHHNDDPILTFSRQELHVGKFLGQGGFSIVEEIYGITCRRQPPPPPPSTTTTTTNTATMTTPQPLVKKKSVAFREIDSREFMAQHCLRTTTGDARYAIKQLKPTIKKGSDSAKLALGLADLVIEASFLRRLQHPNIVKLRAVASSTAAVSTGKNPDYFLILDRLYDTLHTRIGQWRKQEQQTISIKKKKGRKGNDLPQQQKQQQQPPRRPRGFMSSIFWFGRRSGGIRHHNNTSNKSSTNSGHHHRRGQQQQQQQEQQEQMLLERLVPAYDLSAAIEYLHDRHIWHRDIKPTNVGFDIRGDIKIFDFGLAREVDPVKADANGLYKLSGMTGTLRYMAPEVAAGLPYHAGCDVYSFCITLWEMLTLQRAYDDVIVLASIDDNDDDDNGNKGVNMDRFVQQVCGAPPLRPSLTSDNLSPSFQELLHHGWTAQVHDRLTMSQVKKRLQEEVVRICRTNNNDDDNNNNMNNDSTSSIISAETSRSSLMLRDHFHRRSTHVFDQGGFNRK